MSNVNGQVNPFTPEQIVELAKAGVVGDALVNLVAAMSPTVTSEVEAVNADAPAPAQPAPEAEEELTYKSVAGYECKTKSGARWASGWIIKHRGAECNCGKGPGNTWTCRAVKNYGETAETHGSDPALAMPSYLLD